MGGLCSSSISCVQDSLPCESNITTVMLLTLIPLNLQDDKLITMIDDTPPTASFTSTTDVYSSSSTTLYGILPSGTIITKTIKYNSCMSKTTATYYVAIDGVEHGFTLAADVDEDDVMVRV